MPEVIEQKLKELELKFSFQESIIRELREQLYKHTHVGYDKTSKIFKEIPIVERIQSTNGADTSFYSHFFINSTNRRYVVTEIKEVHGTAGTDAGDVTLQVERLQGTEIKTGGDALLSTAFNLKTAARTVQTGTLIANPSTLTLEVGDRLGLFTSGVITSVADVCVVVYLREAE